MNEKRSDNTSIQIRHETFSSHHSGSLYLKTNDRRSCVLSTALSYFPAFPTFSIRRQIQGTHHSTCVCVCVLLAIQSCDFFSFEIFNTCTRGCFICESVAIFFYQKVLVEFASCLGARIPRCRPASSDSFPRHS